MKTLSLLFSFPIALLISLTSSFLLRRNGAPKKTNANNRTIMDYGKGARTKANFAKMLHRILYVQFSFQIFFTNLTFTGPCIVIYSYSTINKMHLFLKLFILVKLSTCVGRSFRPSSGAQNCTYGNRHMSNNCCYVLRTSPLAAAV